MKISRSKTFVAMLAAGVLVLPAAGGAEPAAVAGTSPAAKKALRALVTQTAKLPATSARKPVRLALRRAAQHALKVAPKTPCTAVSDLQRYRKLIRGVRIKQGKRFQRAGQKLAALGPASLKATRLLLADKRTKRCGGGVTPSTRKLAKTTLLKSTTAGFKVRVQLPALSFVPRVAGGHAWTQLALPNTDTPSKPGTPAIPIVSSTFAVPDGAKVVVDPGSTTSYTVDGVDVFPAQPDPVDDPPDTSKPPYADKPFLLHVDAYRHGGFVPAEPASGAIAGTARDLTIGRLQIPAAQYDAKNQKLKILNSVDVNVMFAGGSHGFAEALGSPWEASQRALAATLFNGAITRQRLFEAIRRCGEEMLVITNPSTRAAADQFAVARRLAGIRTTVVETGAGTNQIGTTATQIQTYIRARLTQLRCIHPRYVTIMGDDELVPTFTNVHGTIPSDLPYAKRDDADDLPDVAVGRILASDQASLAVVVGKIIGYETTSPTSGTFLKHATIAAQFQDDNADGTENRTFVQFAETVRNGLVAQGHTVDRVYTTTPTTTPLKFNDGTDLPADLKRPTFAWNGTAADITANWNDGRFMIIHRDHGYSDGWVNPGFTTANAEALTNGSKLPVVLSVNCSSAAYDYDESSFTQQALGNANGGAVGVFGDTRDSPTWHNSQLALGIVDGMLPYVLPAEGTNVRQRVGDALITGKLRLAGLASPATDGNTVNELYMWHYFGDPSMQMWGGYPKLTINPALLAAVYEAKTLDPGPDPPPPYRVHVTVPIELLGQSISLLRNGQVIGRGIVGAGGVANIEASFGDGSPKPSELQVAVEPDGGEPVRAPVSGVPKLATTLSQTCPASVDWFHGQKMTITGTLSSGVAGQTIRVVFTRPDESTFTRTTTTGANGAWTLTIDPVVEWKPNPDGIWHAQSHFDGDGDYGPSDSTTCSVNVFNGG